GYVDMTVTKKTPKPRRRVAPVRKEDWQEEFDRGLQEWPEWITSERARQAVARRKAQAADELEAAFFFGVLTGAKRAGTTFPPPRNWRGEQIGDVEPEKPARVHPPGWTPRMVRKPRS
ncbi:MAG: hypothetical protein WC910_08815, partial [Bacteroidales bacterium]